MAFEAFMDTDAWYEKIFKARDYGKSITRPVVFATSEYRGIQDHQKIFSRGYFEDKLFKFNPTNCEVMERKQFKNKPDETAKFIYEPESSDELSAVYRLRTLQYEIGKEVKFRVYTSGKVWWLSAMPEQFVTLEVPHGKFQAIRLNVHTEADKDYKQTGIVKVWIATEHPNKLLLKVEAEIKLGSFIFSLKDYTPPGKR